MESAPALGRTIVQNSPVDFLERKIFEHVPVCRHVQVPIRRYLIAFRHSWRAVVRGRTTFGKFRHEPGRETRIN